MCVNMEAFYRSSTTGDWAYKVHGDKNLKKEWELGPNILVKMWARSARVVVMIPGT